MDTGRLMKIVLSVGLRLVNLARFARDQSKYYVESAPSPDEDQNSNSSASLLNSKTAFSMELVFCPLLHRYALLTFSA